VREFRKNLISPLNAEALTITADIVTGGVNSLTI